MPKKGRNQMRLDGLGGRAGQDPGCDPQPCPPQVAQNGGQTGAAMCISGDTQEVGPQSAHPAHAVDLSSWYDVSAAGRT